MATKLLKSLILSMCILCAVTVSAQDNDSQPSKEMVIAQMNYCINSLTNIINNSSMYVLDHETDMLLNNLTMEHVSNLDAVVEFRSEMIDQLGRLQITEEERELLKRINEMQREAMFWQSLSSGLNPTMLLMPGGKGPQMAFMALLSAARTVVEYKTEQKQQDIAELKAMWELRKKDLESYKSLRIKALELEFKLYGKYHLKESDRLTEKTASDFQKICSESDASKRLRQLEHEKKTFGHLLEYPYYVGMAYIDVGKYQRAKPFLLEYLRRYGKTPIFRYDEKSGCVALAILTYETNLSPKETESYIEMALTNLPSVGVAALQCILKYIQIGKNESAYRLLCNSIDNRNLDNKDALIIMASQFIDDIKKYPSVYSDIDSAISTTESLTLTSVLAYKISSNPNALLHGSAPIALISKKTSLQIKIPSQYLFDLGKITVYSEEVKKGMLTIFQYNPSYADGIPLKKIRKEVKCFEANPDLKYLFMNTLVKDSLYLVKDGLDYSKILSNNFPGLKKFNVSKSDREKIVKFCKKNVLPNPNEYRIKLEKSYEKRATISLKLMVPPVLTNNHTIVTEASDLFVKGEYNVDFSGNNFDKYGVPHALKLTPNQLIKIVFSEQNPIILSFTDEIDSQGNLKLFSIETNDGIYFYDVNELLKSTPTNNPKGVNVHLEDKQYWWEKSDTTVTNDKNADKKKKSKEGANKRERKPKDKKLKKTASKEADNSTSVTDDQPAKTSLWQKIKSWFTRDKSADKKKSKSAKDKSNKKKRPTKDKKHKKSTLKETDGPTSVADDQPSKGSHREKVKSSDKRDKKEKRKSKDKPDKKESPTKDKKSKKSASKEN